MNVRRKTRPAPWVKAFARKLSRETDLDWILRHVYRPRARAFLAAHQRAGFLCPVVLSIPDLRRNSKRLTEVHHVYGRLGPLLLWEPGWLVVSRAGHRWIHDHPTEARRRDWLAPAGQWNNLSIIR